MAHFNHHRTERRHKALEALDKQSTTALVSLHVAENQARNSKDKKHADMLEIEQKKYKEGQERRKQEAQTLRDKLAGIKKHRYTPAVEAVE